MRLSRRTLSIASLTGVLLAGGALVAPATPAQAASRSGEVDVIIPSTIVIDGNPIHVTVSSTTLTGYSDKVWVSLYNGTAFQGTEHAAVNHQVDFSTLLMKPGTITGRASLATTYCSVYSSDYCSLDNDGNWYTFVTGLTYPDSTAATAKYASKITLAAVNDGERTTWSATVQRYGGYSWQPWTSTTVSIGPATALTDDRGVATWVEPTAELHSFTATAAETSDVWGSTSAAVQPAAPTPTPTPTLNSAPSHSPSPAASSSSATKIGRAVARDVPHVRKTVILTKNNDANHLLGKPRGYQSAAVLVDRRLHCKGDPGVGCGATIEKFASATKAKHRKQYIQKILRDLPALGKEHDTVEGRFLLRVSGKLSTKQAAAYRKAFRSAT